MKPISDIKKKSIPILKKYSVHRAGIFGSYARGEQRKDSDIDFLVEMDGSLFLLAELEMELQRKFGRKIDILSYNGINKHLRKNILKEEVRIL